MRNQKDGKNITELAAYPFITLDKSTPTAQFVREYFFDCGIRKNPEIEVASAQQIVELVKEGIGIGFVAEYFAKDFLRKGEIEEIKMTNPPAKRNIYLVEDRRKHLSKAAEVFKSYITV